MMISMFQTLAMMLMTLSVQIKNPMKMSFMMVLGSACLMKMISLKMGKNWMAMNIFLLFMGGIMLMFMILSSTSPNEKYKKAEMWKFMSTALMVTLCSMLKFSISTSEMDQMSNMKMFVTNTYNMTLMMSMMVFYFSSFIKILSKNKNAMRSH